MHEAIVFRGLSLARTLYQITCWCGLYTVDRLARSFPWFCVRRLFVAVYGLLLPSEANIVIAIRELASSALCLLLFPFHQRCCPNSWCYCAYATLPTSLSGTPLHRYTGTQIPWYTGIPAHWYRYTGTQYTGTPVHRYTGTPVHRYTKNGNSWWQ